MGRGAPDGRCARGEVPGPGSRVSCSLRRSLEAKSKKGGEELTTPKGCILLRQRTPQRLRVSPSLEQEQHNTVERNCGPESLERRPMGDESQYW